MSSSRNMWRWFLSSKHLPFPSQSGTPETMLVLCEPALPDQAGRTPGLSCPREISPLWRQRWVSEPGSVVIEIFPHILLSHWGLH